MKSSTRRGRHIKREVQKNINKKKQKLSNLKQFKIPSYKELEEKYTFYKTKPFVNREERRVKKRLWDHYENKYWAKMGNNFHKK